MLVRLNSVSLTSARPFAFCFTWKVACFGSRMEVAVITLVVIGVISLIVIATLVGLVAERDARARAWRRIAEERRWIWEQRSGAGDNSDVEHGA